VIDGVAVPRAASGCRRGGHTPLCWVASDAPSKGVATAGLCSRQFDVLQIARILAVPHQQFPLPISGRSRIRGDRSVFVGLIPERGALFGCFDPIAPGVSWSEVLQNHWPVAVVVGGIRVPCANLNRAYWAPNGSIHLAPISSTAVVFTWLDMAALSRPDPAWSSELVSGGGRVGGDGLYACGLPYGQPVAILVVGLPRLSRVGTCVAGAVVFPVPACRPGTVIATPFAFG